MAASADADHEAPAGDRLDRERVLGEAHQLRLLLLEDLPAQRAEDPFEQLLVDEGLRRVVEAERRDQALIEERERRRDTSALPAPEEQPAAAQ